MTSETRKKDHLELTKKAQQLASSRDSRFLYEPLFSSHAKIDISIDFLGKKLAAPLWISSMTGGVSEAGPINKTLAQAASFFKLGMGLGSCRVLLEDSTTYFDQFNLRPILGDELPLFANLGIAQVETLLDTGKAKAITKMVQSLSADGLIVHINPLQEWYQPEGDRFKYPPIETLNRLLNEFDMPLIVKEVGQGFGPESLKALVKMPLAAVEFGAYGGTNFSKLEWLRDKNQLIRKPQQLCFVGHSASEMVASLNIIFKEMEADSQQIACDQFIISGGVDSFIDGFFLTETLNAKSCYGQAGQMLTGASKGLEHLKNYISSELSAFEQAKCFLKLPRG